MRECMERNGSAQNGSKTSCKREAYPYLYGTVPYRTVPKSSCKCSFNFSTFGSRPFLAPTNQTLDTLAVNANSKYHAYSTRERYKS